MPLYGARMAILVDQIVTHSSSGTGDDTVPPGISGLDWAHIVSTASLLELETFLTVNIPTCPPTNVRTPLLGSQSTYAGLSATQLAAAIAAGATALPTRLVRIASFDHQTSPPYYEP